MDDKFNQIKAFQQAEMMIHIITHDEYFYGGYVLEINKDFFIIEDVKVGKMPISFLSIKKITKFIKKGED